MKLSEIISKAKTVKCKERVLPVLSITMRDGFVLQSDKFKKEIASKDKSSYNVVKKNQLVQSIHIDEGGFAVQTLVDEGIVSPAYRIWDVDTSKVDGEYLSTVLRSPRSIAFYKSKLRGSIQRRGKIDDADILGMDIPVPTIAAQLQILNELHLLTGIIDKQKAQIKELDTLAQSIFYDMFGDPVENEREWESKPFQSICNSLFAGGDVPKDSYSDIKTKEYSIPILSNGVGEKAIYGYTDKARVFDESITISGRGTIGYCEVRKEPFFPVVRLIVAVPNKDIVIPVFLKFIVDALHLNGVGVAIPQLTIPMVKDISIILPSIELQQSFAQKIQSIESQKATITRSIAETRKLFDYTMDKYFG